MFQAKNALTLHKILKTTILELEFLQKESFLSSSSNALIQIILRAYSTNWELNNYKLNWVTILKKQV